MGDNGNGLTKQTAKLLIERVMEKYPDPLELLTAKQASELTKIPLGTIYHYTKSNQIPFVQVGSHIRFSPLALVSWSIERHGVPYLRPGERRGSDE
jgi:excisionase family DNA binding protein